MANGKMPRAAKQLGNRKMPRAAKQLGRQRGGKALKGRPSNNPAGNPGEGPCIPCWVAGLGTVTHHFLHCPKR
jgi:hypothetical protein